MNTLDHKRPDREKSLEFEFSLRYPCFKLDIKETLPGKGVTAIFGPSGSGKTTLLRCIAGLQPITNGFCRVGDKTWQSPSLSLPVHQRELGYVFQQANLFEHLTIEKNLLFGFQRIAPEQRNVDYEKTVSLLGLENLLGHYPGELSGGQQQRAAIARALLTSPKLLLMDEPLANLDTESKQAIIPYLEQLHDTLSIPVIYVSHSLDEILRIADHMVYMENGRVLANGAINEVLTRADLPLAYLDESATVLESNVKTHHDSDHLTEVSTSLGEFFINRIDAAAGHPLRIRVAARDVSITLSPATDSSIQHIFAADIIDITPSPSPARQLVRLSVNDQTLLASITTRSVKKLNLRAGLSVYAQVKSVALMSSTH